MNDNVVMAVNSTFNSILQFITLLIVFVVILFATYWTTKFVGSYQKVTGRATNFEVIETYRIANTKYLQIVKAGNKYLVISVCKENITLLTELSEEEVTLPQTEGMEPFAKILEKVKNNKLFEKNNKEIKADEAEEDFGYGQEGKGHSDDDEKE